MEVTRLPFNKLLGLSYSHNPHYLLMLEDRTEYHNHLGTVHASAQFALAEATSGLFLLREFETLSEYIPVVRKVETKFRNPAVGEIFSSACFSGSLKDSFLEEFQNKHRAFLTVRVTLFDARGLVIMVSDFEWFVARVKKI